MKEVYYKGLPYYGTRHSKDGQPYWTLKNGNSKMEVKESDLDIQSVVAIILDSYYKRLPKHFSGAIDN